MSSRKTSIHPWLVSKGNQIWWSFGWDRLKRGPVSQQAWHYKDPSCTKVKGAMQTLALTVQRPQPFCHRWQCSNTSEYSQTDLKQFYNEWINQSFNITALLHHLYVLIYGSTISFNINQTFRKKLHEYKKNLHFLDTNTKHRAKNSITCFKLVWIVAFFGNFMIQHGVFWSVKYILQAKSCTKSGSRYIII